MSTVLPSILTLSISALVLTSRIPVTVTVSVVAFPRVTLPSTSSVPEISTLSLISTKPSVESKIKLPEVVRTVLLLINTLSISALVLTSRTPVTVTPDPRVTSPSTSSVSVT